MCFNNPIIHIIECISWIIKYMFHKCCRIFADLSRNTEFCFGSVLSVSCGPDLRPRCFLAGRWEMRFVPYFINDVLACTLQLRNITEDLSQNSRHWEAHVFLSNWPVSRGSQCFALPYIRPKPLASGSYVFLKHTYLVFYDNEINPS